MAIKYRDIGFVADTSSFNYDECIDQALGSLHDEAAIGYLLIWRAVPASFHALGIIPA